MPSKQQGHSSPSKNISSAATSRDTPSSAAYSKTTSFVPIFTEEDPPENHQVASPSLVNIDNLLEKISQEGMQSLSLKEKELLQKARRALLERDGSVRNN